MTLNLTIIGDRYSGGGADQISRLRYTGSFVNPYTASGELITAFPFKQAFYGGRVTMVHHLTATATAGSVLLSAFRGDTTSTASVVLQLFSVGLNGGANIGNLVDFTGSANLPNTTCYIEVMGK